MTLPYPAAEILFVEYEIYETFLPLEYAVACFYVGRHGEAIEIADRLLVNPQLTPALREQITRNRQFSLDALAQSSTKSVSEKLLPFINLT